MVVDAHVVVLLLDFDAVRVVKPGVWAHPVHVVVAKVVLAYLKVVEVEVILGVGGVDVGHLGCDMAGLADMGHIFS